MRLIAPVDSGQIVIGDPCYLMSDGNYQKMLDDCEGQWEVANPVVKDTHGRVALIRHFGGYGVFNVTYEKNERGLIISATIHFN
jgi:hypothetical protein